MHRTNDDHTVRLIAAEQTGAGRRSFLLPTEPSMTNAISAPVPSGTATEVHASGRVLARLAQAMAAALLTVQRERIRPRVPRPLHRV